MIRRLATFALIAGASLLGTGGWMLSGPPPFPTAITLSPTTVTLLDNVPTGTLVSTATVTMSDGSQYAGMLSSSDSQFVAQGLNIVTAAPLTPDGPRNITITAN